MPTIEGRPKLFHFSHDDVIRGHAAQPYTARRGCTISLAVVGSATAQPGTLNLSHDLVPLGIAAQNVVPNSPSLDARPLFYAGMWYAQSHGLTRITVDPGAYYFLTEQYPGSFLELHEMHDLTFDLAGSTIYLKFAYSLGINLTRCRRVTLTNFQIDFIELPYHPRQGYVGGHRHVTNPVRDASGLDQPHDVPR